MICSVVVGRSPTSSRLRNVALGDPAQLLDECCRGTGHITPPNGPGRYGEDGDYGADRQNVAHVDESVLVCIKEVVPLPPVMVAVADA